jgi:hypothetical protein
VTERVAWWRRVVRYMKASWLLRAQGEVVVRCDERDVDHH